MKRSISPDFASEAKRFDPFPPSQYKQHNHQQQQTQQQQQMHIHQQQQMLAQQQMQVAAAAAAAQQQQQQFQMHQQIQAVQQQQQQQYASNPAFFNQASFFPMNSVNMSPFPNPATPLMYNSSPTWNYMSTPPPFFTPTPSTASTSAQPPLPPPELKAEKPPLPKDPEPALGVNNRNDFLLLKPSGSSPNYNAPRLRTPGVAGGIRIRGVNALNGVMYNGFNGGSGGIRGNSPLRQPNILSPNSYTRNRRRNPHHFPGVNTHPFFSPAHFGDYNEMPHYNEEEQPAGPEKLTIFLNEADKSPVQVNKKAKRKPMSTRYSRAKEWVREDAEAALALEHEYSRASRRQMLILKFPDPDLNKYIVKKYSPFIETVHFQQPSTPRYCFVQLKEGADVPKVLETIREIPFGTGKIVAELKCQPSEDHVVSPEEIDPYTLYIGNLPTSISVKAVKEHFPNAQRIDIGYAQRMRYTRYAFIRYNSYEEASKAYRNTVNALLESRSLIVRFRRQKGNIGLPGETKTNNPPREDPEALPTSKVKPWEDADDEDYHEDDEAFLLDDIEEDDDDVIDHDEDELNTLRPNLLPFGALSPKEEIGIEKDTVASKDTAEVEDTKAAAAAAEPSQPTSKPSDTPQQNHKDSEGLAEVVAENDNQEASTSKAASNVKATNSTAIGSGEPSEDCKVNVLEKAQELLQQTATAEPTPITPEVAPQERPKSESPDCICTDPPETERKVHLVKAVKLEHSIDDSSSDNEGINLLGTRVKDEFSAENPAGPPTPTMDDIYLDDYEYDDMDEEPEEEDDDWADTSLSTRTTNWEELRRRELNAKEDKPDLDKLVKISDTLSQAAKVLPMVANLEPKNEFEKLYTASQAHKISDTIGDTDDLHDMFAEMNSDLDEDDDTQF